MPIRKIGAIASAVLCSVALVGCGSSSRSHDAATLAASEWQIDLVASKNSIVTINPDLAGPMSFASSKIVYSDGVNANNARFIDAHHRLKLRAIATTAVAYFGDDPAVLALQGACDELRSRQGMEWHVDGDKLTLTGERYALIAHRL